MARHQSSNLIYIAFSIVLLILNCHFAYATFLSNGFLVTSHYIEFDSKCSKRQGKIFYPILTNDNEIVSLKINKSVQNFVETYATTCNKKVIKAECESTYDVRTGSKDYFSVKWTTKCTNGVIRVDSLNFSLKDGSLLSVTEIFSPLAKNFMPEIVKLSKNNLPADTTWQQFTKKIKQGDIQLYIFESNWRIVFNPNPGSPRHIVDAKLPKYLLRTNHVAVTK
jgi:hypothetical protein